MKLHSYNKYIFIPPNCSCDAGELYLAKSLDFIMKNISEVRLKFAVNDGLDTTEGLVSSIS